MSERKLLLKCNLICAFTHLILALFKMQMLQLEFHLKNCTFQAQHTGAHHRPWWTAILLMIMVQSAHSQQCPWAGAASLQAACVCAFNLAKDLSVQCDQVNIS